MTTQTLRELTCTSCNGPAGRWQQWPNLADGYGICRVCADWIQELWKFGSDPVSFRGAHGVPGIHYEPHYHEMQGRRFVILASYPRTPEGAEQANLYMEIYPEAAVMEVNNDRVILGDVSDEGVRL